MACMKRVTIERETKVSTLQKGLCFTSVNVYTMFYRYWFELLVECCALWGERDRSGSL